MKRATLVLLGRLWLAQVREQPGRLAVASLSVAVGVTLGLAIWLVNESALAELDRATAALSGEADLQLAARAGSFDESVYPRIVQDPDVAAASPIIDTVVAIDDARGDRIPLRLIGIDVLRAVAVAPRLAPMAAPGEPGGGASPLFADDTLFLSPAASRLLGRRTGDRVVLGTAAGTFSLRVAGSVAVPQPLAVMDIGAAQWRVGWLGRLSRIDIRVRPGASPRALHARLETAAPDAWLRAPDAETRQISGASRAYRVNLTVLAMVSLVTGGFVVYTALALAVRRQIRELALLATLGASRTLLVANVIGQGAAIGTVGAALGVAQGTLLAGWLLSAVGGDLGGGYFQVASAAVEHPFGAIAAFAAVGIAAALAGALRPALALRRLAPAAALRAAAPLASGRGPGRRLAAVGTLIVAGAALCLMPPVAGLPLAAYLAILLWLGAAVALVGPALAMLARVLAPAMLAFARWPIAWLALQRPAREPAAASAAVAGVVASFALASAMTIMVHSFKESLGSWLAIVLPADIYVRVAPGAAHGVVDEAIRARIASSAGVASVALMNMRPLALDAEHPPVTLIARDLAALPIAQQLPLVGALRAAPQGCTPVYASEAAAAIHGLTAGARIMLPVGSRRDCFVVSGVWRDYARQAGAIVIARDDYRRLTGDDTVTNLAITLDRKESARPPGSDPTARPPDEEIERLARTIVERLEAAQPGAVPLEIRTATQIRSLSLRLFDRSFAATHALELAAILVALFGVAAAYAGEAFSRAREFGLLRHLGLRRRELITMIAMESGLVVSIGTFLGAMAGVAIAKVLIERINPQSFHWTMQTSYPVLALALAAAALLALGMAAASFGARSAAARQPIRAVREDW